MTRILAIDPGSTESGWCVIDAATCRPISFGKTPNDDLRSMLVAFARMESINGAVIEMIASYGMSVGQEVFDTCVWVGRFAETLRRGGIPPELIKRQPIKLHHCRDPRAKDSNVSQALKDRFAPGQPNHGKGTKAAPGWFYGFAKDVWQAYALAVYAADVQMGRAA